MIVGAATVFFSAPVVLDPAKYRCQLSRVRIDDVNNDKKDWNNVDTGVDAEGQPVKPQDLPCDEAIRLAQEIPLDQKGKKFPLPSETALATQNGIATLIGLGQALSGFSVIRKLNRQARIAAIVLSLLAGIFFPVFSLLSVGVLVFVAYAFGFSPAAREVWPREIRG